MEWWTTQQKVSLAVPTQGILRISSPLSLEDPNHDEATESSDFVKSDQDTNQSEGVLKIDHNQEVCLSNMVILTENQEEGKKDECAKRKGNFSKRKLSYNARSDTVLEMCDSEEISFIDDDPCDIITDDNFGNVSKVENGDNQIDNLNNMQQIVIKINNEIELTSIIVNTHNQLNCDLSKNLSLQEDMDTEDLLTSDEDTCVQIQREEGQVPENPNIPNISSSENLSDKLSFYQAVCSTRFLTRRRQGKSLLSQRNVLVRQEKLDCDFHPGLARKRHSFVPENQGRHRLAKRIRKTASL